MDISSMPNSTIAEEILKNPDLSKYLSFSDIPLLEIRNQILNHDQIILLKNQGLTTLQDLRSHKNLSELATITEISLLTLQKLVSAIELLFRGLIHNTQKFQIKEKLKFLRIVFFGLNHAGKSSIIKYLRQTEPLTAQILLNTLPTIGNQSYYGIRIQEIPVILSELGGQNIFRESYIQNLQDYFRDARVAVFVIDSKAPERFEQAFFYLEQIIQGLNELSPKIELDIKIAVHKSDLGALESSKVVGYIIDKISAILNTSVIDLINSTYTTSVHDYTSISNLFMHLLEVLTGPTRSYIITGLELLNSVLPFEFCCLVDPELSRLPLGWVINNSLLDRKIILNNVIILIEKYVKHNPDPERMKISEFTIVIDKWIREMTFLPVEMSKLDKSYLFIYCFADDYEYGEFEPGIEIEDLVVRAIEPQLELALLAIKSKP